MAYKKQERSAGRASRKAVRQTASTSRARRGTGTQFGSGDDNETRTRVSIACGRCRKRKIKCSGETADGLPCEACQLNGCNICEYLRVSSQSTTLRSDISYKVEESDSEQSQDFYTFQPPYNSFQCRQYTCPTIYDVNLSTNLSENYEVNSGSLNLPLRQNSTQELQSSRDWGSIFEPSSPYSEISNGQNFEPNGGLFFPCYSLDNRYPSSRSVSTISLSPLDVARQLPAPQYPRSMGAFPVNYQENYVVNEYYSPSHVSQTMVGYPTSQDQHYTGV